MEWHRRTGDHPGCKRGEPTEAKEVADCSAGQRTLNCCAKLRGGTVTSRGPAGVFRAKGGKTRLSQKSQRAEPSHAGQVRTLTRESIPSCTDEKCSADGGRQVPTIRARSGQTAGECDMTLKSFEGEEPNGLRRRPPVGQDATMPRRTQDAIESQRSPLMGVALIEEHPEQSAMIKLRSSRRTESPMRRHRPRIRLDKNARRILGENGPQRPRSSREAADRRNRGRNQTRQR